MNYQQKPNKNNNYKNNSDASKPAEPYTPLTNENYVGAAEKTIEKLNRDNRGKIKLTTSQIRNILSMINQIYNDVVVQTDNELPENVAKQLQYLKVKIVYSAGRNPDVKDFVDKSRIVKHLDHVGNDKEQFMLFAHYVEALVAYHRFEGGSDK